MSSWIRYFAYGSNLHPGWMRRRVPSARILGAATLPDHALAFRKRGRDGSAKSDAAPAADAVLPGAVYEMRADDLPRLGAAEGGYRQGAVMVETAAGPVEGFAWFAREEHHVTGLPPWDWYVSLILEGARFHGLPESHRRWLAGVAAAPAPGPAPAGPPPAG
ncbi:MAG: gamma-glutamylcyclotransferase family protein, partial [Anaerolineae bacterium]